MRSAEFIFESQVFLMTTPAKLYIISKLPVLKQEELTYMIAQATRLISAPWVDSQPKRPLNLRVAAQKQLFQLAQARFLF